MPKKRNKKKKAKKIVFNNWQAGVGFLILALVAFFTVISWGIYKLDWNNQVTKTVTSIIPYPAARVDSSLISYKDYVKSYETAKQFFSKQQQQGLPQMPSDKDIKKFALERLIDNIFVEKIADKYNINITNQEVQEKLAEIITNQGSRQELSDFLQQYYNLSIEEYEKIFTAPDLLYEKTNQAVVNDDDLNGTKKQVMEMALNELNQGQQFEEVAGKYSVGSTAKQGGLLGDFQRGELPKELENQLFSMEEGQYTDIVVSENSMQIIKLENKNYDQGVLTLKTIAVRIITLDDLIKEAKTAADIRVYIY